MATRTPCLGHLWMSWFVNLKKCTFLRIHYVLFYDEIGKMKQLIAWME